MCVQPAGRPTRSRCRVTAYIGDAAGKGGRPGSIHTKAAIDRARCATTLAPGSGQHRQRHVRPSRGGASAPQWSQGTGACIGEFAYQLIVQQLQGAVLGDDSPQFELGGPCNHVGAAPGVA